jgi:hypothetical protein
MALRLDLTGVIGLVPELILDRAKWEFEMTRSSVPHRGGSLLGMLAVAAVMLGMLAPAATASSARTCRVINSTEGKRFPPDSGQALTTAIAVAMSGELLTVMGTCSGTYELDKDLTVTGISTKQFQTPTLNGGQAGSTPDCG